MTRTVKKVREEDKVNYCAYENEDVASGWNDPCNDLVGRIVLR